MTLPDPVPPPRRAGRWRRALAAGAAVAVVLATLLTGAGWYYAGELLDYPRLDDEVAAEAAGRLVAEGTSARVVTTDGPLGTYRGVLVDGSSSTWAVFVHGRGGPLLEGEALLDPFVEAGLPVLFTSFRNDDDAPDDPDGVGTFGHREWRDLQAWIDEAQARGADAVVLVGFSMGGSVVSSFLQHSADADEVVGLVLDSPVVSMHETLRLNAGSFGIPDPAVGPLLVATKAVASLRAGIDFAALEHADRWAVDVPVLLVHGTGDRTVPDDPTVALARRLGDRATLLNPRGVDHVAYLREDPDPYLAAVEDLLDRVPR